MNPVLAKVVIPEVTNRPTYELVTRAGGDRPVYVGSAKWREQAVSDGSK
jgi:hypothetical protein